MYRIIKIDGTELGITDSVHYIKIGTSGSFASASAEDAIGVAFDSVAYNLAGHEEIDGAETVVISKVDGGNELMKHEELMSALTESMTTAYTSAKSSENSISVTELADEVEAQSAYTNALVETLNGGNA